MAIVHNLLMAFILIHWNAQSLSAHGSELKHYIDSCSNKPHVVCIQETWLSSKYKFSLPGYNLFRRDRSDDSGRGGCAILVHQSVSYREIKLPNDIECMAVEVFFAESSLSIVNVYHPESTSNGSFFTDILDKLPSAAVLCGDFDSHNRLWGSSKTDAKGKILESFLDDSDMVLLNDGSGTRVCNNGTLSPLDLTIVDSRIAAKCSWSVFYDSTFGSDHYPVFLRFQDVPVLIETVSPPRWKFDHVDWDLYSAFCTQTITGNIVSSDINDYNENLVSVVIQSAEACVPVTKPSSSHRPGVPWWNKECAIAVKARKRALNRAKHTSDPSDYLQYKSTRAKTKRIIKQTKREFWRSYCSKVNKDVNLSRIWRTVKNMSRIDNSRTIPTIRNSENQILVDPFLKANAFVEQVASISNDSNYTEDFRNYKTEFEKVNYTILHHTEDFLSDLNEPFTIHELTGALSKTKESSPGADRISYTLLKRLPTQCLLLVLQFFNSIWEQQILPTSWKHSVIIPILKPGKDPSLPASYRPIALTSCLCKLMEKMINFRLLWFLESNDLLTPVQSGFRRKRSTMDQIVRLENSIQRAFLNKEYVLSVHLDFEKAYDMLWTNGLLFKLHSLGVRGRMFGWIRSFLQDRTIQVRLHQTFSKTLSISKGTPQGSVLSPTLFNIMVNDLHTSISKVCLGQFADDGSLWKGNRCLKFLKSCMEYDLKSVSVWCSKWGFRLSTSKTVAIIFTRRRIPKDFKIFMNDVSIKILPSAKVLGCTFDRKLNWNEHVDILVLKCTKVINLLRCLTGTDWGAHTPQLLQIYKALIRSRLDYCCQVYESAFPSVKAKLDIVQSRALRVCLGVPRTTSIPALQVEAGEMPLDLRRNQMTVKYYLRCMASSANHPARKDFEYSWQFEYYRSKCHNDALPFLLRSRILVEDMNLENVLLESRLPPPSPPWHLDFPNVFLDLTTSCVKTQLPVVSKNLANEFIDMQFSSCIKIFTDGSKSPDDQCSAAFVIPEENVRRGFKLPDKLSVFKCELLAILFALEWISNFLPDRVVILSDSLSALQVIAGNVCDISSDVVGEILHRFTHLSKSGLTILFSWIPSHVGIAGNELADQTAKGAISSVCCISVPLSISEVDSIIRSNIRHFWQGRWNDSFKGRSYFRVNDTVSSNVSFYGRCRREQVLYSKLRLNQCWLNRRKHILGKHPTGLCDCGEEFETVEHFLLNCPLYVSQRNTLLYGLRDIGVSCTMKGLLGGNAQAFPLVLDFIKASGKDNL